MELYFGWVGVVGYFLWVGGGGREWSLILIQLIITQVLTVGKHLQMLPLLLGKQSCLNFTVTFLFSPVAGIFELPVKNFAILLIVTIAFPQKKISIK